VDKETLRSGDVQETSTAPSVSELTMDGAPTAQTIGAQPKGALEHALGLAA
jgi:hypothetical protein